MNDLAVKVELAPRMRRFLRELRAGEVPASDVTRDDDGSPLGNYPSRAEIDRAIARARVARSLEMKRLLRRLLRLVRRFPGAAGTER